LDGEQHTIQLKAPDQRYDVYGEQPRNRAQNPGGFSAALPGVEALRERDLIIVIKAGIGGTYPSLFC
jgi:hypothetical protein